MLDNSGFDCSRLQQQLNPLSILKLRVRFPPDRPLSSFTHPRSYASARQTGVYTAPQKIVEKRRVMPFYDTKQGVS
jgi:hypothetical protein